MFRLLRDVGFFRNRVSKIEGSGDVGDFLYNIVDSKRVEEPRSVETVKAPGPLPAVNGGDVSEPNKTSSEA